MFEFDGQKSELSSDKKTGFFPDLFLGRANATSPNLGAGTTITRSELNPFRSQVKGKYLKNLTVLRQIFN